MMTQTQYENQMKPTRQSPGSMTPENFTTQTHNGQTWYFIRTCGETYTYGSRSGSDMLWATDPDTGELNRPTCWAKPQE